MPKESLKLIFLSFSTTIGLMATVYLTVKAESKTVELPATEPINPSLQNPDTTTETKARKSYAS